MDFNLLRSGKHAPPVRRGLAAVAAALIAASTIAVVAGQAHAAPGCRVTTEPQRWPTGFTAHLSVTNLGDPLSGWTLTFSFTENEQVAQGWNGHWSQSGRQVSVTNETWNANLPTGASVLPGFNASFSDGSTFPADVEFKLNGTVCTSVVDQPSSPPPTSSSQPSTSSSTPTNGPDQRVDNPYTGAIAYVNPEWSAHAAAEPGGTAVSSQPTGVWLDSIQAIYGTSPEKRGLRAHLDTAMAQGANLIQVVIFNLPGRECGKLVPHGELGPTELDRYRTEFIDPIADIFRDPAYRSLRIVAVIEPEALASLIINSPGRPTETLICRTMNANNNYQKGIAYALGEFYKIPNVYSYLDAAHHGVVGWDDNFYPTADLMAHVASMAEGGLDTVTGIIVNTANYSALTEPYFTIDTVRNGVSVRQSMWVDWNRYVDELTFAQAFLSRLRAGFGDDIGVLVDTSRNGWGGPNRPIGPGTAMDVNTFVDQSRIDRRLFISNWCNQEGAGLGERPQVNPMPGIDAFVWMKPPGESDGSSQEIVDEPFDRMCDPLYDASMGGSIKRTGALPNAPARGKWFSAQFQELMRNAYPPLVVPEP